MKPSETQQEIFSDLHPPLTDDQARIEAARCYYCYDAPCMQACPTKIDIPGFIRRISSQNNRGAAVTILDENILGGTCARVCPTESLCEGSCVRTKAEEKPVEIGLLQRFATDTLIGKGKHPYVRAASTAKRVAVVGAGPSGLSCAHRLSRLGHQVTVFEANEKAGGLNEYGLAPHKMVDDFAQKEVDFVLQLGGITLEYGKALGRDQSLDYLRKEFDAVFLGVGLGDVNHLNLESENTPGVINAVEHISKIRQSKDFSDIEVGKSVVVIGGGSTAIDIAVEARELGADHVTLVYRRGEDRMNATWKERDLARNRGVQIRTWAQPARIVESGGRVTAMEFEMTRSGEGGKLEGTGEKFTLNTDQVFKAIGQTFVPAIFENSKEIPDMAGRKIAVDEDFLTTLSGVYAGGDCIAAGDDLTVTAVQQGKLAALAIHKELS